MQTCELRELDIVTYENGLQMQEALVGLRQQDQIPDQLLLLEHTPVITLGRGGKSENLLASQETLKRMGVRFYETTRGGDITYHGPGQLVAYPILHLGEGRRDVRKYVTKLEEVLIRTARSFGVESTRSEGNRGVWIGNREKLASIGVRIAKWVTSHGIALNVSTNLDHFNLITPCGIRGAGVTSLQKLTGTHVTMEAARKSFARHFADVFERDLQPVAPSIEVVKVVVLDQHDRVLLLHRRTGDEGWWQPVTGTLEPGETLEAAAGREVSEETGQRSAPLPLELTQSFLIDPSFLEGRSGVVFAREHSYVARIDSEAPIRLAPEEHDRYGWFTLAEARESVRWSDDREAIERVEVSERTRYRSREG